MKNPISVIKNNDKKTIVGVVFPVGDQYVAGIGEADDEDDERDATPSEREAQRSMSPRRRRRFRAGLRALKNVSKNVSRAALRSAIPAQPAARALTEINRTRADLETLAQLQTNPNSDESTVSGIGLPVGIAYQIYRG